MDEHSPIRHVLVLRRIDPDQGMARFYSLMVERDLFGTIRLVRNWGRIGTNGQELVEVFADGIEAGEALEAIARVKRQRGIGPVNEQEIPLARELPNEFLHKAHRPDTQRGRR